MSGATMLLMGAAGSGGGGSGSPSFTATVTGGPQSLSGPSGSHTFGALTCTISGGTAPITQVWSETDDSNGTWTTGGTATTFTPHVGIVEAGDNSFATYICTATDATGAKAVSNPAMVSWKNTTPGARY